MKLNVPRSIHLASGVLSSRQMKMASSKSVSWIWRTPKLLPFFIGIFSGVALYMFLGFIGSPRALKSEDRVARRLEGRDSMARLMGSDQCDVLGACKAMGANCGIVSVCNVNISCGSCVFPETCGGGRVWGHCGCTPIFCSLYNRSCGTFSNGCGGSIDCGPPCEPITVPTTHNSPPPQIEPTRPYTIGYYNNWAYLNVGNRTFAPKDIQMRHFTHIIFAFAHIDERSLLVTKSVHTDEDGRHGKGLLRQLADSCRQGFTVPVLGVGGRNFLLAKGNSIFHRAVSSRNLRKALVTSVIKWMTKYGYRGVEWWWDAPGSEGAGNFLALIKEMREALKSLEEQTGTHYWQSVAVSAGIDPETDSFPDKNALSKSVDWVTVITFGMHTWNASSAGPQFVGAHAPLVGEPGQLTVMSAMDRWERSGIPRTKLVEALAQEAYLWTLKSPRGSTGPGAAAAGPGWLAGARLPFAEIASKFSGPGCVRDILHVPSWSAYAVKGDQWASFDDPRTAGAKLDLVLQRGYAGIALWSIDMDHTHTIASAISTRLNRQEYIFGNKKAQVHLPTTKPGLGQAHANSSMATLLTSQSEEWGAARRRPTPALRVRELPRLHHPLSDSGRPFIITNKQNIKDAQSKFPGVQVVFGRTTSPPNPNGRGWYRTMKLPAPVTLENLPVLNFRSPYKKTIACHGSPCPLFSRCVSGVSSCWQEEYVDPPWEVNQPLNMPTRGKPLVEFELPGQVFAVENVYLNEHGEVFNATHVLDFGGCSLTKDNYNASFMVREYDVAINLVNWNFRNIYHTIMDTLVRLILVQRVRQFYPNAVILVRKAFKTYGPFLNYTQLAGVESSTLNYQPVTKNYIAKAKLLIQPRVPACGRTISSVIRRLRMSLFGIDEDEYTKMAERTRDELLAQSSNKLKIVLGVREGAHRVLNCSDEVHDGLVRMYGADRVVKFWGNISREETVSLFHDCVLHVAPHGAGLTNAIFQPPGSVVLEIRPDQYRNRVYQMISQMLDLKYYLVWGTGGYHGPVTANATEILSVAAQALPPLERPRPLNTAAEARDSETTPEELEVEFDDKESMDSATGDSNASQVLAEEA